MVTCHFAGIGYAQGMNDILARFLVVTGSEIDSYFLFKKYMDDKRADFLEDTMMAKLGEFKPFIFRQLFSISTSSLN